jgi:ubiquinone/menaquinone biosynthesis C-methylase UbiE
MNFAVSADDYDSYMGRHSRRLAPLFADFAEIEPGQRVLDVGCGPGALTGELARRVGAERVAAVDPSAGFAFACAERFPGAEVREGPAEQLPWPPASFDAALAQLVVSFLAGAEAAVGEMRRVVRAGGNIAACSWDHGGEMWMIRTFWDAALALDPGVPTEARVLPYIDRASLAQLWRRAGLRNVRTAPLVIEADYSDFDDYWQPFLTGTGPAGAYCVSLDRDGQAALRAECFRRLGTPSGPFTLTARAWAVRGVA